MNKPCGRCSKVVYPVERIQAADQHWHKRCFTCAGEGCGTTLNMKTMNVHKGEVYCSAHVPKWKATASLDKQTQHAISAPKTSYGPARANFMKHSFGVTKESSADGPDDAKKKEEEAKKKAAEEESRKKAAEELRKKTEAEDQKRKEEEEKRKELAEKKRQEEEEKEKERKKQQELEAQELRKKQEEAAEKQKKIEEQQKAQEAEASAAAIRELEIQAEAAKKEAEAAAEAILKQAQEQAEADAQREVEEENRRAEEERQRVQREKEEQERQEAAKEAERAILALVPDEDLPPVPSDSDSSSSSDDDSDDDKKKEKKKSKKNKEVKASADSGVSAHDSSPVVDGVCSACEKVVKLTQDYAFHENRMWHIECFKCHRCTNTFDAKDEFVPHVTSKDKTRIFCVGCFEEKKANRTPCEVCKLGIKPTQDRIKFGEDVYHNDCFKCSTCSGELDISSFYYKDGAFACENCEASALCTNCQQPIKDSTYPMIGEDPYHQNCLVCSVCNCVLTSPYAHENKLYCEEHCNV